MSIEFHPATCGMCRKHWKRTSIHTHSASPLNAVAMFGKGATQGFVCEKCNLFICELCFLKTNRCCFFCGNQNCGAVWVESLTQSEQQMHRGFKKHILIHVVSGIVWVIGTGIAGSFINPNIPLEKSVGISVATVLLMLGLVRTMRGLSPFDKKSAILVGSFFGGFAGTGVGTIVGWGGVWTGGAFGLGLVPSILGCALLFSICVGYSLSAPARILTDNGSPKAHG